MSRCSGVGFRFVLCFGLGELWMRNFGKRNAVPREVMDEAIVRVLKEAGQPLPMRGKGNLGCRVAHELGIPADLTTRPFTCYVSARGLAVAGRIARYFRNGQMVFSATLLP